MASRLSRKLIYLGLRIVRGDTMPWVLCLAVPLSHASKKSPVGGANKGGATEESDPTAQWRQDSSGAICFVTRSVRA